ncbi:serine/threonine-protein kinase [Chitinivorax sp. PXF-14]|uniref:serine/threonine-protein kinase n=1 Tax=Chitinivorax sp. PXF-14 TaxID=3230488 RepID=UPI003465ABE3
MSNPLWMTRQRLALAGVILLLALLVVSPVSMAWERIAYGWLAARLAAGAALPFGMAAYGASLLLALGYGAALARGLSTSTAAIGAAVLSVGLLVAEVLGVAIAGAWLPLASAVMMPWAALLAWRLAGSKQPTKRTAQTDHYQRGLALQSQGRLDLALEAFRRAPTTPGLLDALYRLAAQLERDGNKGLAQTVLAHLLTLRPNYRDVAQRLTRKEVAEPVIQPRAMPARLGDYAIDGQLGRGSMGVVYRGHHVADGKPAAIKTMALAEEFEAGDLPDARERFLREAETAGGLQHPNIVTIYGAGEDQSLAYIAMELLDGHDLNRYTKPDQLLPIDTALEVAAAVASAIDYANRAGIVHRDIKPANIMYLPAGRQVKVTDFGVARVTDANRTRTGMVLGTPSYMSPEQLAGKKIDGRSDLYSLGVTLYQLLTGQLPFQGNSLAKLMYSIANERHRDISELRPELPRPLCRLIDRALDKAPDKRFQTGAEFALAIQQCREKLASKE